MKKKPTLLLYKQPSKNINVGQRFLSASLPLHIHNFYEIDLFTSGHCEVIINGVAFPAKPGFMSLLTPNDTHQYNVAEPISAQHIGFVPDSTGHISIPLPGGPIVYQLPPEEISVAEGYIRAIKDETSMSDRHSSLGAYAALALLIIYLLRHGEPAPADSTYLKLQPALLYICQHCLEDSLDLSRVAGVCHLSTCYFSSTFKKIFGKSFSSYLNECRLRSACYLLTETDTSVTDIAYKSGFSSSSHFFRVFKNYYRCSPTDYRQHNGAASTMALDVQIPLNLWSQGDNVPTILVDH